MPIKQNVLRPHARKAVIGFLATVCVVFALTLLYLCNRFFIQGRDTSTDNDALPAMQLTTTDKLLPKGGGKGFDFQPNNEWKIGDKKVNSMSALKD